MMNMPWKDTYRFKPHCATKLINTFDIFRSSRPDEDKPSSSGCPTALKSNTTSLRERKEQIVPIMRSCNKTFPVRGQTMISQSVSVFARSVFVNTVRWRPCVRLCTTNARYLRAESLEQGISKLQDKKLATHHRSSNGSGTASSTRPESSWVKA